MRVKRTELDRITVRLRSILQLETKNIVKIGELLNESHRHLDHGEWQAWLADNFDLSYRTALRYETAAKYVARRGKSDTAAHLANLSPTMLYALAEGHYYSAEEEQAILAATLKGRVDQDAARSICRALTSPKPPRSSHSEEVPSDAEIDAILDGPPPAVPPPAPLPPPPPDFALRDFDQAISTLKRLTTKPSAQFAHTAYSAHDLETVEAFVRAVAGNRTKKV
jgi:hypothetical protein